MFSDQSNFNIRLEWALPGLRHLGPSAEVLIIVDALSFSTCVDVAISRGAIVFPYRWKDESARAYAAQQKAELAGQRGQNEKFSLSPVSMQNAAPGTRIVLPSPNGSELTTEAAKFSRIVLTACFRNSHAVSKYAASHGNTIAVIPAGERWPDGTLRPAIEDLAAAGRIVENLFGSMSPEASAALAVWNIAKNDLPAFLASCSSGRELIERGFDQDVKIAAQANITQSVPILSDRAYIQAGGT